MSSLNFSTANLGRYPAKHSKDLQAWDAADEYLAQFIPSHNHVLLVNDSFGALDCAVRASDSNPVHINDSWCSLKAIEINSQQVPELFSNQHVDCVLVKLHKSLSLLTFQLNTIANQIDASIQVFFSGMQKHVGPGHLHLLKEFSPELEYLPTLRKARMYKGVLQPQKNTPAITSIEVPELNLTLQNVAGVFAEEKVDIGSRFFIENFHRLPAANRVADVGCGNGLLSLAYHRLHPAASITMTDESRAAIESARISFSHNYPQADIELLHNDGLHDVSQVFDLIVINPPFHQQNTVTTDIAMSMFAQAKACLAGNGELWIVANRHLNYQSSLKRWFRKVNVVTQNDKFIIIQAKQ